MGPDQTTHQPSQFEASSAERPLCLVRLPVSPSPRLSLTHASPTPQASACGSRGRG